MSFQPLGYNTSFAEMDRAEKNKISHRFKAFREFKVFVKQITGI
jgi:inosine/xanthosine triphosphate pyrophosphatase family protein